MNFTFKIVSSTPGIVDEYVYPDNAEDLQIEYYETTGQKYIRERLNDTIVLSDSDYRLIYPILTANKCEQFHFYIYRTCTGTEELFYDGLFTFFSLASINESDCSLEFKVDTNDLYRTFLNKWKDEYNVLQTKLTTAPYDEVNPACTASLATYIETRGYWETQTHELTNQSSEAGVHTNYNVNPAPLSQGISGFHHPGCSWMALWFPPHDHYIVGEIIADLVSFDDTEIETTGILRYNYTIQVYFQREVLVVPEQFGTFQDPDLAIWTFRQLENIVIGGVLTLCKIYSRSWTSTLTGTTSDPEQYLFDSITYPGEQYIFDLDYRRWKLDTQIDNVFDNCRRLRNVIDFMLAEGGFNNHLSNFFYNETNPVTLESGFPLKNLLIGQKTDFILGLETGELPTNPATKQIWSLENCLNTLRDIFNVYWYFDGIQLRIEHETFFNNGLAYPPNENFVDIAVDSSYLVESNKYSIDFNNFKGREVFKWAEADGLDFIGLPIKYRDCVPDLSSEQLRTVDDVTTDIIYVYNSETYGDVTSDGLVLLHCSFVAGSDYMIENELGLLASTMTLANGHLTWSRLQERYWRPGVRLLENGSMNGDNSVMFPIVTKNKIQEEVSFPLCCQDFNPYMLVKLNTGETGKMRSASLKLESEALTIQLAYDV